MNAIASSNRSCLIVERELLVGMDLEDILDSAGYMTHWVASIESALKILETGPPDVAIINVVLQDGPCTEVVRELKRLAIPFIVHSGCCEKALELAEVPWLAKPASDAEVLEALSMVLTAGRRVDKGG